MIAGVTARQPSPRHYAPWDTSRQERISSLMLAVYSGTNLAQSENEAGIVENRGVFLVDLVRFELKSSSMPFKKYQSRTGIFAQN